jgi:hypothetical protein
MNKNRYGLFNIPEEADVTPRKQTSDSSARREELAARAPLASIRLQALRESNAQLQHKKSESVPLPPESSDEEYQSLPELSSLESYKDSEQGPNPIPMPDDQAERHEPPRDQDGHPLPNQPPNVVFGRGPELYPPPVENAPFKIKSRHEVAAARREAAQPIRQHAEHDIEDVQLGHRDRQTRRSKKIRERAAREWISWEKKREEAQWVAIMKKRQDGVPLNADEEEMEKAVWGPNADVTMREADAIKAAKKRAAPFTQSAPGHALPPVSSRRKKRQMKKATQYMDADTEDPERHMEGSGIRKLMLSEIFRQRGWRHPKGGLINKARLRHFIAKRKHWHPQYKHQLLRNMDYYNDKDEVRAM